MNAENTPNELDALNGQAQDVWNRNADWWDEQTGEGNKFQRVLIGPATERLLALRPGERVLDIAEIAQGVRALAVAHELGQLHDRRGAYADALEAFRHSGRERERVAKSPIEPGTALLQAPFSALLGVGEEILRIVEQADIESLQAEPIE